MDFSWLEMWIGVFIVLCLVYLAIRTSHDSKIIDDQKVIDIIRKNLDEDLIGKYEITSIVTLDEKNITTVIVNIGSVDIALEVDNKTGKVLTKEKLIR